MAHASHFIPFTYVRGLYPVPLTQKDKNTIVRAVSEAKKSIPAKSLDSFFDEVEFAIARYRADTDMAKHLTKVATTKKLISLRDQTRHLLDALIGLDNSTQWLIRDHDRSTWIARQNDNTGDSPITSLNRMPQELCGFLNVLSAVIARVNTWPKGRREDHSRMGLAYSVANTLRQGGIKPTLTRNGAYAHTLCAVMGIIGGELRYKHSAKKPDVMALMRHGLRILKSESPKGVFTNT